MANPRKFSEKIALQKQKQAEGTAEFEKIMKEVYATKMDDCQTTQRADDVIILGNNTNTPYRESRDRSVGVGPMRRPSDRKVDRSPYSGANIAFLSPPSDSSWRRTNSDSAIHQSLQQTQERRYGSQLAQRKMVTNLDYTNVMDNSAHRNSSNVELRHGLQYDTNNTYKTDHDNAVFNPMANTGSLPDLTSVHFSSAINPSLEKEPFHYSSSPYSSGNLTSPTMISPTLISNRYHSPAHSPNDNSNFSPTHYAAGYNQDSTQFNQYRQSQNDQTTHLSFTSLPVLANSQQQSNGKNFNISSSSGVHGSHGQINSVGMSVAGNLTEYRNSLGRCSPGSSPGLMPSTSTNESSIGSPGSPIVVYNNKNSESCSKNLQNSDGYPLNPAFHNHFEQFSLIDNAASDCTSNVSTAQPPLTELQFDESLINRIVHNSGVNDDGSQFQQIQNNKGPCCSSSERNDINVLSILGGNLKLSNDSSPIQSARLHQFKNQPRTNTSTTIPEIVFSDFSSGPPDFSREIFGSLDLELGVLDMQMLSDPNSTITDPSIEDSFRRDLT